MSITKKSINNNEYMFINHSRSNRSGFVHETELYKNDRLIGEYRIQYYNRTWERYQYQSVMRGVVNTILDEEFELFKNEYKRQHNIKRLTKQKESEMMQDFAVNKSALYTDLQELYNTI